MIFKMIFLMEINIFDKYGYLTKMQRHVVVLLSSYTNLIQLINNEIIRFHVPHPMAHGIAGTKPFL